jgi:hypothetical protein
MNIKQLTERYKKLPGRIIPRAGNALLLSSDHIQKIDASERKKLPDGTSRQRWLKIATSDPDRSGDVMVIEGMITTNFDRNPQFLWQHGLTSEPVHTIGHIVKLYKTITAIYALAEYATSEESALAEKIYKLDVAGLLPANSIGFRPIEWEPNEYGGVTFKKWELIEVSKVEIPCNPFAIDEGQPAPKALSISEAARLL